MIHKLFISHRQEHVELQQHDARHPAATVDITQPQCIGIIINQRRDGMMGQSTGFSFLLLIDVTSQ